MYKKIVLLLSIIVACSAYAKTKFETVEFNLPGGTFILNIEDGTTSSAEESQSKTVTLDESVVTYTGRKASDVPETEITQLNILPEQDQVVQPVADTGSDNYSVDRVRDCIYQHEGKRYKIYLDVKYLPTVCVGNNLHGMPVWVNTLEWKNEATGSMLNSSQKSELYDVIMAYAAQAKSEQDPMVKSLSTNTISHPDVKLSDGTPIAKISTDDAACENLLTVRLNNAVEDLRTKFKGWDSFPNVAKDSLVDMRFAMGSGAFSREWTKLDSMPAFFDMIDNRDWRSAAEHLKIWNTRESRKEWLSENFLRAAMEESGN